MRPLVASDTLGRAERNFAISFCVQDLILIIFIGNSIIDSRWRNELLNFCFGKFVKVVPFWAPHEADVDINTRKVIPDHTKRSNFNCFFFSFGKNNSSKMYLLEITVLAIWLTAIRTTMSP